jgi:hypothetical protein
MSEREDKSPPPFNELAQSVSSREFETLSPEELIQVMAHAYLVSGRFNGLPLMKLAGDDHEETRRSLRVLIDCGLATIVFGDIHPNPFIRALPDEPKEETLRKLDERGFVQGNFYPTRAYLDTVVTPGQYPGRPYTYELARGEPQLGHRAFELRILEDYRNDPRFEYSTNDIQGQIYAHDDAGVRSEENVYLRFGFAFGEDRAMFVAAMLWDLSQLSPEAQQRWRMREVDVPTSLHPDHHRAVMGHFPERLSLYEAFIMELETINRIAAAIGRPGLFRHDHSRDRPREFGSLLRPTVKEFNDFVATLDKMISDNIDLAFFGDDVARERRIDVEGGGFRLERKGSLQLLEEWLRQKFRPREPAPMDDMLATFRKVRKLRNKPAHVGVGNAFDPDIALKQRDLMEQAYTALRTLRLILMNHPLAREVEIDSHLREGLIWTP